MSRRCSRRSHRFLFNCEPWRHLAFYRQRWTAFERRRDCGTATGVHACNIQWPMCLRLNICVLWLTPLSKKKKKKKNELRAPSRRVADLCVHFKRTRVKRNCVATAPLSALHFAIILRKFRESDCLLSVSARNLWISSEKPITEQIADVTKLASKLIAIYFLIHSVPKQTNELRQLKI